MPVTLTPFRAGLCPMVSSALLPLALVLMGGAVPVQAASITWVGGTANWADATGTASWSPADEPDSDDTAIFNTDDLVTLTTGNTIVGLTMSGSITVDLNGNTLTVGGLTTLSGSGTRLELPASSVMTAQDITINSGGTVFLDGGSLGVSTSSAATNAVLATAAGGTLSGNGTITMSDVLAATTTAINNNGDLTASNPSNFIFNPPAVGTLHLATTDVDARLDLDGSGEAGAVTVGRNQTLDIDLAIADIFNGSISMFQETKLDIAGSWILGANGTIDIDNGSSGGIPSVPAGTAIIAGGSFSQNSGTITVVDVDGTLQFDAPFTLNGGTLANNGNVIFNSSTVIANAANFTMPTTSSSLTVGANRTVTINQANFNLDGSNAATNVITVNDAGTLNINTGDYDPDSATNAFDGTVNLVNATISVNIADAEFVMDGVLNSSASGSDQSLWTGDNLAIGNDAGVLDADVNITGSQPTQFGSGVRFNSDADLDVAAGATAHFLSVVNFNSVNGGNNAQFTGSGELIFSAGANFTEATHLNMAGGTMDLDGADSIGDTINIDSPLTISAALVRSFGKNNGGGGTNLLDINNSVGTGSLTVNLDAAAAEWTLNSQGVMNLVNDNTEATLLAGNGLNVNGTVNVTGDVRSTARLDLAGTVNINTAGEPLRLAGGSTAVNANTIAGATIGGVGLLGADTGKELRGFGTINAGIDFDGTANLLATGGTLTLGGSIVDVNTLGTADDTGTLNITSAWETDGGAGSIGSVVLAGGTLQGSSITNDSASGIQGHGTIKSRVTNNSKIVATNGGTLLLQTVGNDDDWDGAANTGELQALTADLELVDISPFTFGGKVTAVGNHRVYANGFGLDFFASSTLELDDTAIYQASTSTDFGGTVLIDAGASATIQVGVNYFMTFKSGSTTTLNGNLQLLNNNINIEAGATFNGNGTLTIPSGNHLVMDPGATANVLLDLKGAFRPGNFNGVGQCTVKDLQMAPTTALYPEIIGTGLNQYDRISVNGIAVIDGYLAIDIDEVSPGVQFVPQIGDKFNILSASGGVTGRFKSLDVSGTPPGLTFKINYLPTIVQVEVIAGSEYEAWVNLFPSLTNPDDRLRTADPDHDGMNNLMEFAFDGDPTNAKANGKIVSKIAPVAGVNALTITIPARWANEFQDPPGGEFLLVGLTTPHLNYRIQASDNLTSFGLTVDKITGADATALQAGLPALNEGWTYFSFRSPGPVAGDPQEFMRVDISEGP